MKNREWSNVTACCKQAMHWKKIPAAEAPARMRHLKPTADGFRVSFCPGCGEVNPELARGCHPWEAVGLPNPERLERGLRASA